MTDWAIRVESLSKTYRIGGKQEAYKTFRESFNYFLGSPFRKVRSWIGQDHGASENETIFALKDVSFEVKRGETVGIVGRNGAGKSTLLKILSRITEPSSGSAEIRGRVGSLLEVGTGFHPELTGRENIYLNGAILGMKKTEIETRFDQIVSFAELEKFLDTPVKHYSSGMYVRLAFAVAAHMDPDVLLVDEVLAVGDLAFQKKCLGKMDKIAGTGRTVMFVSHNLEAITSLTRHCLYLKGGQIQASGESAKIVEQYYNDFIVEQGKERKNVDLYKREPFNDSPVQISDIKIARINQDDSILISGDTFSILVEIENKISLKGAALTVILKDPNRNRIAVFFSWDQDFRLILEPGRHVVELKVNSLPLSPGQYFIDAGLNQSTQTVAYDVVLDFPLFHVALGQTLYWPDRPWGALNWDKVEWSVR